MVRNINISATFSSITLAWDELSCVDQNGFVITGYRVDYGTTAFSNTETISIHDTSPLTFIATALFPLTTYIFRVAGITKSGIGEYSNTVSRKTSLSTGMYNIM